MYAACLVDALKNDEPLLVEVINCIMSDPSPHTATEKCMENLMIEEPSFQEIEDCHSSDVGENLLYDFGVKTHDEGVYGVPWITIDDVSYFAIKNRIQNPIKAIFFFRSLLKLRMRQVL